MSWMIATAFWTDSLSGENTVTRPSSSTSIFVPVCLEVHVAVVVLAAHDVRQYAVALPRLDQPHGDARDVRLDRHTRVHEREGRAAPRGHRRRAVRLEDVRDHADGVRKLLLRGQDGLDRALGERAVADVASRGSAEASHLADRE